MGDVLVGDSVIFVELAAVPRISDAISVVVEDTSIFNQEPEHVHLDWGNQLGSILDDSRL